MALPRPAFFPSKPPSDSGGGFSLTPDLIRGIFRDAKPLGHHEDPAKGNLGFGFLYYSLARMLRPRHVLVIGSGFGFSVVCFGLGLKDNGRGRLSFVDPSYSILTDGPFKTVGGTSQWHDPAKVRRHFARFGLEDIVTHHCMTSAEFFDALPSLSSAAARPRLHRRQPRVRERAARLSRGAAPCAQELVHPVARHQHLRARARAPCRRQTLDADARPGEGAVRDRRLSVFVGRCDRARGRRPRLAPARGVLTAALVAAAALAAGYLFWRYVWFFRNPAATPPSAPGDPVRRGRHRRLREEDRGLR